MNTNKLTFSYDYFQLYLNWMLVLAFLVFRLRLEGATFFYLSDVCLGLTSIGLFSALLVMRRRLLREVAFEATYLSAPLSAWPFSTSKQIVNYSAVSEIRFFTFFSISWVRIRHNDGKTWLYEIPFESSATFSTFILELERRVSVAEVSVTSWPVIVNGMRTYAARERGLTGLFIGAILAILAYDSMPLWKRLLVGVLVVVLVVATIYIGFLLFEWS